MKTQKLYGRLLEVAKKIFTPTKGLNVRTETRLSMAQHILSVMRDSDKNTNVHAFDGLMQDGIHLLNMDLSGKELLDKLGDNND